jgi:O-antigen/teichoic acid export membrane protein
MRWRSLALNLLSHGVSAVLAFGFAFASARLLSVGDNGELRYAMTLLPLLMTCTLPGFDSLILRQSAAGRPLALRQVLWIRMSGGLIGAGGVALVIFTFPHGWSPTLLFFMLCTALALPFFETGTGFRNFLVATYQTRAGIRAFFQARAWTLGLLGLGVILLGLLHAPWIWIYPVYLLAMSLPMLMIGLRIALRQRMGSRVQKPWYSLGSAAMITGASLVYTYTFSLDKLIVHGGGATVLARYGVLLMIPLELARLIDASLPLFYKSKFMRADAAIVSWRKWLIPGAGLCVSYFVYVAAFHTGSSLVFGPDYQYSWTEVMMAGLVGVGQGFDYVGKQSLLARWAARGLSLHAAFSLGFALLLFPWAFSVGGTEALMLAILGKQALSYASTCLVGERVLRPVPRVIAS